MCSIYIIYCLYAVLQDRLNNLSWDDQKLLLDETVNLLILRKYPLDIKYVVRFIRFIIERLESQDIEVHGDFYTTLCNFQSKTNENPEYSFKHFQIKGNRNDTFDRIFVKENLNKISFGTTGLGIWESALALSEWAILNKEVFCNKNILELGAGTGLSSLIISKCCSPKSVFITDGNDKVIDNLRENVSYNFDKASVDRYYHAAESVIGNSAQDLESDK